MLTAGGFYFISFATFNAAAAFIIVTAFTSVIFFTIFAPVLRTQLVRLNATLYTTSIEAVYGYGY